MEASERMPVRSHDVEMGLVSDVQTGDAGNASTDMRMTGRRMAGLAKAKSLAGFIDVCCAYRRAVIAFFFA